MTRYLVGLTEAQRTGITAIAMDMWEPYRQTVRAHVPAAARKIVFDRFDVFRHGADAVDQVRRGEHKALAVAGDTRLARTKYLWLRNTETVSAAAWRAFGALRTSIRQSARAWALKESLRRPWEHTYVGAARTLFARWHGWPMRSRLAPMKRVARMLETHLDNILTYLQHPITNAVTEGLHAKIQWIKVGARGYRNRDAFKMATYCLCGGLDLEPRCA